MKKESIIAFLEEIKAGYCKHIKAMKNEQRMQRNKINEMKKHYGYFKDILKPSFDDICEYRMEKHNCKQIDAYLLRLKNKIKETDRNVSMLDYAIKVLRK